MKSELNFGFFNGIGAGYAHKILPVQAIPTSQKTERWKKAVADAIEIQGLAQIQRNLRFRDYRAMSEGRFTYSGTGAGEFHESPFFEEHIKKTREEYGVPTYIKHFDFIGLVTNAISSVYSEMDSKYRVESIDEYSTNEYIREKTEKLHKFAQEVFMEEVNRVLLSRGIDPNKQDFQSEEEQQQYQQYLEQQTKALTPKEIEDFMAKNFKVLAVEWAENTLSSDEKDFNLQEDDREHFIDFLLSGRWFRHYRVGYDSYYLERWLPEETFFSQDIRAKYPQRGEFVGRITYMSVSDILNRYGHKMSLNEQDKIANYWGQKNNYFYYNGTYTERPTGKTVSPMEHIFPQKEVVPFHNYKDHLVSLQLEDALGQPAGQTLDPEGDIVERYLPRQENNFISYPNHSKYLRDDIDVRNDLVRVCEGYWRSFRQIAVLIYENELGMLSVDVVTDELLKDFLEDNKIKTNKTLSISELQSALNKGNLEDYVNTITYTYIPEVWQFVKIKGNNTTIKNAMYLDISPLPFQIRDSRSKLYDVLLPVGGLIDTGIAQKLEPYQVLHNITMNQNTELLEKELGVFFMFDVTGLTEEYQNMTTLEKLEELKQSIKDTALAPFDLSRQNTQGNQPNLFARQELTFTAQMQTRMQMAEYYKAQGLAQVGITPQMLGQMGGYETAEGIKQGAIATQVLMNNLFDKMDVSKSMANEIHLAVAQYAVVNGKDDTIISRKGDGEIAFINIMKEDGEIFPLRKFGVKPVSNSKDRKIVEQIKQYMFADNTMEKSYSDIIELLSNPQLTELKEAALRIEKKSNDLRAEQQQNQQALLKQELDAKAEEKEKEFQHEKDLEMLKIQGDLKGRFIDGMSRVSDKNLSIDAYGRVEEAYQQSIENGFAEQEIGIKQQDFERKQEADKTLNSREQQKLALKQRELDLKEKEINVTQQGNIINKN